MGVPAFFRWLSRKYPSIVVHCVEEKPKVIDGVKIPVDSSKPNPNNFEFDNLYLDMNGIIHPCCHPENKPAPKDEDEMMVAIFEYIDRIFSIVRPRRLLYMAIDGVAPRAKMNQQRSRRFRASKESVEKVDEVKRIRDQLLNQGAHLPPEKPKEAHFDSNCITPGTPFMDRLAKCLHYYIHVRLNTDPGWRDIEVILSDANVPGEGEHKIMNFIRKQRANPDHDPNTAHCLCGADADLIMLGLATHEPNFTIIREEFKPNQPRPCEICAELGHDMQECTGLSGPLYEDDDDDKPPPPPGGDTEFIFLRLNVLREYLEEELTFTNLPFEFDLERAIDDWVFMCFFVGNDFLPHLPSLEIREGAIDRLVEIYKRTVYRIGGFITNSGFVEMDRVYLIMKDLGDVEDEIFKKRQQNELEFKRREKNKKRRLMNDRPRYIPGGQYAPQPIYQSPSPIQNAKQLAMQMRKDALANSKDSPDSSFGSNNYHSNNSSPHGVKRKADVLEEEEEEVQDDVRLWEDGFKERYYEVKFEVSPDNIKFRHQVANAYSEGLCWVLRYYYQGCASWNWYFPYHYAPFASDFVKVRDLKINFNLGEPFKPLEQLMGVFPAASKQHLPEPWGHLMCSPDSPIIDFYPTDFKIDLNGKKYAWQGVALLPFVDEDRLHAALKDVYPLLTEEEKRRNVRGDDRLYVRQGHPSYDFFVGLYESGQNNKDFIVDTSLTHGMGGTVLLASDVVPPGAVARSPLPNCEDQPDNRVVCIRFRDPSYPENFVYPAKRLPKAVDLPRVLKPKALRGSEKYYKPQIGMAPARQQASLGPAGNRMLRHNLGIGVYSNVPPPSSIDSGYNSGSYIPNRRSFSPSNHRERNDNHSFRASQRPFPVDRSFSESSYDRSFNDSYSSGGSSRNASPRDSYYPSRSNNRSYSNNSSPWDRSFGQYSSSGSSFYSPPSSGYTSPTGSRNNSFGSSRYSPYPSPNERHAQRGHIRGGHSNFSSPSQRSSYGAPSRESSGGSSGVWCTLDMDPRKNSNSSQSYPPHRR